MGENEEIVLKRGQDEYVLSDKRLSDLACKFIEMCADTADLHQDFGMGIRMIDTVVKVKSAFFPATQKNLNVNVESFDGKIKKWMEAREEMKKAQEEKERVYEIAD